MLRAKTRSACPTPPPGPPTASTATVQGDERGVLDLLPFSKTPGTCNLQMQRGPQILRKTIKKRVDANTAQYFFVAVINRRIFAVGDGYCMTVPGVPGVLSVPLMVLGLEDAHQNTSQ